MTDAPRRIVPADDYSAAFRETVRVFIDGDMPRGVLGYDIEEGWALVCEFGEDGQPIRNGAYWQTRIVTGKIKAVICE